MMTRNNMAENLKTATTFIEQGRILLMKSTIKLGTNMYLELYFYLSVLAFFEILRTLWICFRVRETSVKSCTPLLKPTELKLSGNIEEKL